MQKTINPGTQRPYTISMVEHLMHEVHFAVDPHSNSKKQALDVIRELQKHFPYKAFYNEIASHCSCSKLHLASGEAKRMGRFCCPKDESGTQMSTVCEMEPVLSRECDPLVRNMQGRLVILAVSVHAEGDTSMDHYDEHDDMALQTNKSLLPVETETDPVVVLSMKMQKRK